MTIGFTPKFQDYFYLDNLTHQQSLSLAVEATKKLDWEIGFISDSGFIAYANRGMFSWNAEITFRFDGSKAIVQSESSGSELFDLGRNKKTVQKFYDAFHELKTTLNEDELNHKYEELKSSLATTEEDILNQPPETTSGKLNSFFSVFVPKKGFAVTPLLVDINMLIFVVMVISGVGFMLPDNESLIQWGANFRPVTMDGQWWRLMSSTFLHIGFVHLAMNMYALVYIGVLLEPRLGKTMFFSAYLLSGIIASLTSLAWHPLTISAGASGAIFGMYGVFLALLTTNFIEKKTRKALLTSIGIFVAYNLIQGMKGGIDNAAHLGGLISGLVIGYAYFPSLKRPEAMTLKYSMTGILAILAVSTSFVVYSKIPNPMAMERNIGIITEKMKSFESMEAMALQVYQLPANTSKEDLLYEIKDRGMYYWNENIKLLNELNQLELPEVTHKILKKVISYCNLRLKSYDLLYKTIDEHTDKYTALLQWYNKQIEITMNEIKQGEVVSEESSQSP